MSSMNELTTLGAQRSRFEVLPHMLHMLQSAGVLGVATVSTIT